MHEFVVHVADSDLFELSKASRVRLRRGVEILP